MFIDAGNSFIKFAAYDGNGKWRLLISMSISDFLSTHECPNWLITETENINKPWWGTVVSGEAVCKHLEHWANICDSRLSLAIAKSQGDGINNYYQPAIALGADRYCALLGARVWQLSQTKKTAIIIASFGTAMTMDYLNIEGDFLGGTIAAGGYLQNSSLAANTAQLPQTFSDNKTLHMFPNNTIDAINQGITHSLLGALMFTCNNWSLDEGKDNTILMLTGGDAIYIEKSLKLANVLNKKIELMLAQNVIFEGLLHYSKHNNYNFIHQKTTKQDKIE